MKISESTTMVCGWLPADAPQLGFFLDEGFQLTCAAEGVGYQVVLTTAEAFGMWQELTRQLQEVIAVMPGRQSDAMN